MSDKTNDQTKANGTQSNLYLFDTTSHHLRYHLKLRACWKAAASSQRDENLWYTRPAALSPDAGSHSTASSHSSHLIRDLHLEYSVYLVSFSKLARRIENSGSQGPGLESSALDLTFWAMYTVSHSGKFLNSKPVSCASNAKMMQASSTVMELSRAGIVWLLMDQ